MRNLTLTLDDETARWARLEAARREVSVSRLVREILRGHMQGQDAYEHAMRRSLARPPQVLQRLDGYPSRDDVHDRAGLR